MASNSRIIREIRDLMKNNDFSKNGFSVEQVNESNIHLIGKIFGPPESQYTGGIFSIDIVIPGDYPFVPPICKFITKIWHPNISSVTGVICLDILKDQWAAAMTISSVLLSIQSFLSTPVPNDPQDAVVANQYMTQRQMFDKTAKYWTYVYAMDEDNRQRINKTQFEDFEKLVNNLMEVKNISRDNSLAVLSCNGWDLNRAIASMS